VRTWSREYRYAKGLAVGTDHQIALAVHHQDHGVCSSRRFGWQVDTGDRLTGRPIDGVGKA
jgi:hypothetical protein